jgi:hypothetical protein
MYFRIVPLIMDFTLCEPVWLMAVERERDRDRDREREKERERDTDKQR